MDLTGIVLAGQAFTLLALAVHFKTKIACITSFVYASISLPFIVIGA